MNTPRHKLSAAQQAKVLAEAPAVRFFFDHAGYSYPVDAKPSAQFKARLENARRLADAETRGRATLAFVCEDEQQQWDGECEPPAYCFWCAVYPSSAVDTGGYVLRGRGGDYLAAIGMVGVNGARDPHLRVIEAELYVEALAEVEVRTTQAAVEYETGRVTFATVCSA